MKTYPGGAICVLFAILTFSSTPAQTSGSSTATGTSRAFNPAISVNGLFLGLHTSEPFAREPAFGHEHEGEDGHAENDEGVHAHAHAHGLPHDTGLSVQEVEVQLSAFVDPYLKGDITLAVPGTEGLELEEGYLTTIGLPGITLKAGKFYADFGKHNLLHTHAFPFVDPPVVSERILGGEGLNEVGLGMSALLPMAWYSELTFQILNGDNELFDSQNGGDLAYLGRWRNLWDLDDATTLELGGSYSAGRNGHGELTHLIGGDLSIKWRPPRRARDRGLTFQAEYIQARVDDGVDTETVGGFYSFLKVQVSRRWWIQGRYDLFGLPRLQPERESRFCGMLAFVPSEFSTVRFQYNLNHAGSESVHQLVVQLNFTMGSHPAHNY